MYPRGPPLQRAQTAPAIVPGGYPGQYPQYQTQPQMMSNNAGAFTPPGTMYGYPAGQMPQSQSGYNNPTGFQNPQAYGQPQNSIPQPQMFGSQPMSPPQSYTSQFNQPPNPAYHTAPSPAQQQSFYAQSQPSLQFYSQQPQQGQYPPAAQLVRTPSYPASPPGYMSMAPPLTIVQNTNYVVVAPPQRPDPASNGLNNIIAEIEKDYYG